MLFPFKKIMVSQSPRQKLGYLADWSQDGHLANLLAAIQRQRGETMTSVSLGQIILTPTQPVKIGRPERGSNPGPPDL